MMGSPFFCKSAWITANLKKGGECASTTKHERPSHGDGGRSVVSQWGFPLGVHSGGTNPSVDVLFMGSSAEGRFGRIASDLVSDSGHVLQTCGNMVEEHEAPFKPPT